MSSALTTRLSGQPNWLDALAADGIVRIPGVLTAAEIRRLIQALENAPITDSVRRRGETYAIRNLFDVVPEVARLAGSPKLRRIVESVLGPRAVPVRGILFDKTPGANWKVPPHQDLTIAVRRRLETPGFERWTTKSGVLHVQPPAAILEQMLSVRLHLDECGPSNGPLRVIPGTHAAGRLTPGTVKALLCSEETTACVAGAGDALVMRPLLLHASSPSRAARHRRVIHMDFAAGELPGGLDWAAGWNTTA